MLLSILHVSDLHRDPQNAIRNDVLLTSLETDRLHYADNIRSPELVVVSGDLVQGVALGAPDPEHTLRQQYDEALAFLEGLAHRFTKGDRDRVIIVPGNHDVSAYQFRQALNKVDVGLRPEKKELVHELFRQSSAFRWSWDSLELYEITNPDGYNNRFAEFARCYERFYQGRRNYSLEPEHQVAIFDYPELDLVFAAFSSCFNNDLWNRQGAINPACVARALDQLRGPSYSGRIRGAVWHHNTEGQPGDNAYLDPGSLQVLIDGGFSLALHGHQHRPQFLDTRFRYGLDRAIKVVSAGTLCGGASYRYGRSYNILELDTHALKGRLHVREMQNDNLLNPIWGPKVIAGHEKPFFDFKFDGPESLPRGLKSTAALVHAQEQFDRNDLGGAAVELEKLLGQEPLARPLLLDCLVRLRADGRLISIFDPPSTVAEAIHVLNSLWTLRRRDRLAEIFESEFVRETRDPSLIELREKLRARLK